MIVADEWARSVIRVGDGRGFICGTERERFVITAAHCLPELPPGHGAARLEEITYGALLGPLGHEPRVWAECLFVDPVADLAVLGSPDGQALFREAEEYEELVGAAPALSLADPALARPLLRVSGVSVQGPLEAQLTASMFSLDGRWFSCRVQLTRRSCVVMQTDEPISAGMSGSPIMLNDGTAVGVICLSGQSPNPFLRANLPGWILATISGQR